jgi:membrane associated rhomboid family serine protease
MRDTPAVATIIALCGLMFLLELSAGRVLIDSLALWPIGLLDTEPLGMSAFRPWQIITYAFLHGGIPHLALNMYALWLFGVHLERRWGSLRFVVFFFSCVIGAALTHLAVGELSLAHGGTAYPVVGASGGIFGLLLAFGLLYPDVRLILLFLPVPVKAKWFVIGYGMLELVAGVTGTANGIAHFAHLGGMLTGYLLLRGAGFSRL